MKPIMKFNKVDELEILKTVSEEVKLFDSFLAGQAHDLLEAMRGNRCYGVAAPQIGLNIRMICLNAVPGKEPLIMVNPEILESSGRIKFEEMCLSFPGLAVKTKRKASVKIRYRNLKGEVNVYQSYDATEAVCIQHEINHLDGILLSDQGAMYRAK